MPWSKTEMEFRLGLLEVCWRLLDFLRKNDLSSSQKVAWGSREVIFITKPLEKPLCHVSPPEVNETFQLPMTYARTQLLMMSFWNLNPSSSRTSTPEFNTCDVIRVSEMKGVFSTSTFDLPHHILKVQICRSTFGYHILVLEFVKRHLEPRCSIISDRVDSRFVDRIDSRFCIQMTLRAPKC